MAEQNKIEEVWFRAVPGWPPVMVEIDTSMLRPRHWYHVCQDDAGDISILLELPKTGLIRLGSFRTDEYGGVLRFGPIEGETFSWSVVVERPYG